MKHTTTLLLAAGLLASAPAWAQTPLVALGSSWKYLDNGSDQGTAWTGTTFNDASWAAGNAELGYGDNDEATVVSFGPSSSNKYITTYFRQSFQVSSLAGFNSLKLRLRRDDGAVVYLNGVEIHRSNMPAGPVAYNTFASATVDGANESAYFEAVVPKTALTAGLNVLAVEIHQDRVASSDISFNLELLPDQTVFGGGNACTPLAATHISSFTSVQPRAQQQDLVVPATHTFQVLLQGATPYSNAADGSTKLANDFTAYVPINGSSQNGYLSVNHEGSSAATSGVSILDLQLNPATKLWNVTAKNPVNFAPVVGTYNNCSGGITPWNTVVTCEENSPTGSSAADSNNDGYLDYGWNVELDPATRSVKDQNGDGTPDKLWKMGRFKHENIVVAADRRTVYEGADEGSLSYVYKYVANTAGNLAQGTLYVLQLNGAIGTATTGTWIPVPNGTPTECNTTTSLATALGATNFDGVEDVEISPLDGKIYFTAKGTGRLYRFADSANGVSAFEIFAGNPVGVTNQSYPINYGSGTVNEAWGTGNDNLTFDSHGNLYVLQDGGRNHIWLIKPCHTQAAPQVEIFALMPVSSEPTGMTFSPDENFMFLSVQAPDATNTLTMTDAAGQQVRFNTTTTVVIGRRGVLGSNTTTAATAQNALPKAELYPNPATSQVHLELTAARAEAATVEVFNSVGQRLQLKNTTLQKGLNRLELPVQQLPNGYYSVVVKTATTTTTRPFIKQ
jgi:secreted PhoX family phosphatase